MNMNLSFRSLSVKPNILILDSSSEFSDSNQAPTKSKSSFMFLAIVSSINIVLPTSSAPDTKVNLDLGTPPPIALLSLSEGVAI